MTPVGRLKVSGLGVAEALTGEVVPQNSEDLTQLQRDDIVVRQGLRSGCRQSCIASAQGGMELNSRLQYVFIALSCLLSCATRISCHHCFLPFAAPTDAAGCLLIKLLYDLSLMLVSAGHGAVTAAVGVCSQPPCSSQLGLCLFTL